MHRHLLSRSDVEIERLHKKFGVLVVGDESRVHIVAAKDRSSPWIWEAQFPATGPGYRVYRGVGEIPPFGTKTGPAIATTNHDMYGLDHSGAIAPLDTRGSIRIEVNLKPLGEEFLLVVTAGTKAFASRIPVEELSWYNESLSETYRIGAEETYAAEPEKPFVIFWARHPQLSTGSRVVSNPNPAPGFIVWAEPNDWHLR